MPDVFLSYSRKDKEFVARLHDALRKMERDIWVDWEDIPLTADWWKEIQSGIDHADNFIFVISPNSLASKVCGDELEYAVKTNKRLVPVVHEDTPNMTVHSALASHNWMFFRDSDDFETAFAQLVNALDTDLHHVRDHTRLLIRAREWEIKGQDTSFLLRGSDLTEAENWLASSPGKKPSPTELHSDYIFASRKAANRRQQILLAGVLMALVISLGLMVLSLFLYRDSDQQRQVADSNAATAVVAKAEALTQAARAEANALIADENALTANAAQVDAITQAAIAENNAGTAVAAQFDAVTQRNRARVIALAGQAEVEVYSNRPERAVLLALPALENFTYNWQAERALGLVVQKDLEAESRLLALGDAPIQALHWSPLRAARNVARQGGEKLLILDADGQAQVYDGTTGDVLFTLQADLPQVYAEWSPDGLQIVTFDRGEPVTMTIWDGTTGASIILIPGDQVIAAGWSRDSSLLTTYSSEGSIVTYDTTNWQIVRGFATDLQDATYANFSSDARWLALARENSAFMIDLTSNESRPLAFNQPPDIENTLETQIQEGATHVDTILGLAWSPLGNFLITHSEGAENNVHLWDAPIRLVGNFIGHTASVTSASWSPDGNRLVTIGNDETALLWDLKSQSVLATLNGHDGAVSAVDWSPENARVVTVGEDGKIIVWDVQSGAQLLTFQLETSVEDIVPLLDVVWSEDGTHIAISDAEGRLRLLPIWANVGQLIDMARECCLTRNFFTDEESTRFDIPLATSAPPPPEGIEQCGALAAQLYPGARGQVITDLALRVRSGPGITNNVITQFRNGQTFFVDQGPVCSEGAAWYRIVYGANGNIGWVIEGTGAYLIQPLPELAALPTALPSNTPPPTLDFTQVTATPTATFMPTATPAESGRIVQGENLGEIEPGGGQIWEYIGRAGETFTVQLDAVWDTTLTIYEPNGELLASNDDYGGGLNSAIEGLVLPADGLYLIEVRGYANAASGEYILRLGLPLLPTATPPPSPTIPATPTSVPMGQAALGEYPGELAIGGGQIWEYSGEAGDVVTVALTADWDSTLTLYAPDGELLDFNDDSPLGGVNSLINGVTLPTDGTYRIEVRGYTDAIGGAYILVLTQGAIALPSPTPTPTQTPPVTAVVGENNGALAIGTGNIWNYSGMAGEILRIETSAGWDTTLTVYAPDGTQLVFNDDSPENSPNSLIDGFILPEDGVYQIEVRGYNDVNGGDYTLIIGSTRPAG
ncbi:MAG: TIR domain-containing protein [Chitinophagaceae bacterium]|nr:TIR domain-containing protein [Anaerolineae bacterium]